MYVKENIIQNRKVNENFLYYERSLQLLNII